MPHSLRVKIKGLRRKGIITDKDCDRLCKALDNEDVLDKIRAEIIEKFENCSICEWFEDYDYEENDISEYRSVGDISDIIEIINKYKAESEEV